MAQTIVSSPFTDNRMTLTVTHNSHGFDSNDIGKAVRSSGTDGQFVVARANSAPNAEVVGVITSIDTANQYTITTSGFVDVVAAVPTATAGTVFFLAEAADSQLTSTEPTTVGAVSKPVAVITESNAKMLLIHYRGEVLTSTTQTNAPNDATYVTTTSNSSLSNEVLASALKIDDFAAGDDNTDLDSSTSRHGLLPKLGGGTTNFLRADGTWAAAGGQSFTGDTTVTSGNFVVATAGKGIDFSAQSSPASGMTSELLDHYEEGTFTPAIADATLNGTSESQTYHSSTIGRYTRIGRQVHVYGHVNITSSGTMTSTDGVNIVGFPFTALAIGSLNASFHFGSLNNGNISQYAHISGFVAAGTSYVQMKEWNTAAGVSSFQIQELSSSANFNFSGTYYI